MDNFLTPNFDSYLSPVRKRRAGRLTDTETAFDAIKNNARVLISPGSGTPFRLLSALDQSRERWNQLNIIGGLLLEPIAPLEHIGQPFHFSTWHCNRIYEPASNGGFLEIIPARYSQASTMFTETGKTPVDVVLTTVSSPGIDGRLSLGTSVGSIIEPICSAPLVIGQINPQMPYTYGAGELWPSAFDYLVEMEGPLPELHRTNPGEVEKLISDHVINLIPNKATLQFGIGRIPETIIANLCNHRNLGIHSGMIGDGIIDLAEAGALTNDCKSIDHGYSITAEIIGNRRLYNWVERNPTVIMAPGRYTHGRSTIKLISKFIAINSALQISLDGAVNAETVDGRIISGPGGQPDFAEAILDAPDRIGIVALPATAANGNASRIVKNIGVEDAITVSPTLVDHIVTEFGVANIGRLSTPERAKKLRQISHPRFRPSLN